jgi:hypothetical protein
MRGIVWQESRRRLWTPHVVRPTLSLWLDSADRGALVDGTGIATWTDKSLLVNHGTASASQPTLAAGPAVAFATQYFTGALTLTGGNFSVFSVMAMNTATGGTGRILSVAAAGATDNATTGAPLIRRNGAGTQQVAVFYGGAVKTALTIVYDVPFVISIVVTAGTISTRLNGATAVTNAASVSLTSTRYALGVDLSAAGVGSTAFAGSIQEMIIMPTAAADALRDTFEGYLGYKWTRVMDAAHPYASTPP